ncbi:hypothetical protein [Pyrococcus kukulkanii]|uniref:hypothetical protein n=1 Tax=Pyrococcus kukulkanii TaxID=1609559 RepID=UPI00356532E6
MRKVSVVLTLLVLFGMLSVVPTPVRAETTAYKFIIREYYLDTVNKTATTVQVSSVWLPSGNTLTVQVEPGENYIDYIMSVSTLKDLYALFIYNRANKMQFQIALDNVRTQLNITYTLQSKEYYIDGLPGVTKIYAFGIVKGANWIGSKTFIGEVTLSNATVVAFAGFDLRSDDGSEGVGVFGIPNMDVYNFTDASTWFPVAAKNSKATNGLGVSNDKGLETRLAVHPGIGLKIYDYWNFKYTGGAATLVIFGNNNTVISKSGFTVMNKIDVIPFSFNVQFTLKDALIGQPLDNVVVKEGDQILGTINSGDSIELPKGQHTLVFEKQGYWSKTITIDVQSDTTVEVEMYPSSAAVMIEAPSNITTFENTLTEVKLQIEPIAQEATKNAYLSVSGITPLEVRKDASIISSENGKYYLGDISSPTEITIKFKADTPGTKTFSVTITSQDALGTKTYEATKQIVYTVKQLPFQVQLPTWSVGENEVRINEASGQQVLITLSLLDQNGTEIWSDSYTFGPYEGHAFTVNIPAEGDYTLKVSWNGYTAVWSIKVNPAVSILTDTVNVGKGDIGTIKVKIRNPTSRTQYYTVVLEGGFIEGNVTKQIAVAPLSEKTIDIAFSVPKDVQFDAYDLTLRVLQGNATTYQGLVHVIVEDTGFSLPLRGEGPLGLPLWMWGVLGVVAFLLIVREVRR